MTRTECSCWVVLVCLGASLIVTLWPPTNLELFGPPRLVFMEQRGGDHRLRRFAIYVPGEAQRQVKLPLIVFLHGAGSGGVDGRLPLKQGLAPQVWSRVCAGQTFPYYALFAQARDSWTRSTADRRATVDMVAEVAAKYRIDDTRLYLTGISDGGDGACAIASDWPGLWAALVPISCSGSRIQPARLKGVPVRWYQNDSDDIGNVHEAVKRLKAAGGSVDLIEFDDQTHDAWTKGYADPELYRWLDQQRRRSK